MTITHFPNQKPQFAIPDDIRPGVLVFVKADLMLIDRCEGPFCLGRGSYVVTDVGYEIDEQDSDERILPGIALVPQKSYKNFLHEMDGSDREICIIGSRNVKNAYGLMECKGRYSGAQLSSDMLDHSRKLSLGAIYQWGDIPAALLGIKIDPGTKPAQRLHAILTVQDEEVITSFPARINPRPIGHLWGATHA